MRRGAVQLLLLICAACVVGLLYLPLICIAGPKDDANDAVLQGDYKKAFEILLPLAEAGDVDAMGSVGNMYAFGQGTEIDMDKAYAFWLKASEKHLGSAMGYIAALYSTGQHPVQRDDAQAAAWHKRAAEHGHWKSMMTLSSLYVLGRGIEKNKTLALAWAGLAASNAPGQKSRDIALGQARRLASGMSGGEVSDAQALGDQIQKLIDENIARYKNQ
jgi:TPR repeat protein